MTRCSAGSSTSLSTCPRPIAICGPGQRKKGTSLPTAAAASYRSLGERSSANSRSSATSVAAASELPPPSPPPAGTRFSMVTRTSNVRPSRSSSSRTIFAARLSAPGATSHATSSPAPGVLSTVTWSASVTGTMSEAISWNPSGRTGPTSSARLSLAGAATSTLPGPCSLPIVMPTPLPVPAPSAAANVSHCGGVSSSGRAASPRPSAPSPARTSSRLTVVPACAAPPSEFESVLRRCPNARRTRCATLAYSSGPGASSARANETKLDSTRGRGRNAEADTGRDFCSRQASCVSTETDE